MINPDVGFEPHELDTPCSGDGFPREFDNWPIGCRGTRLRALNTLSKLNYGDRVSKVETHYDLLCPLNDAAEEGVAGVHSWYGIFHVRVSQYMSSIDVEYDASRLTEKDVEAVLIRFGIPIKRKWSI